MKIAIYGYGNLGRGVEAAMKYHTDAELVAVFTRRDPASVKTAGAPVYSADDILEFKDKIDVLILCGGSATDLPHMTHTLAGHFNVIDSYDTRAFCPRKRGGGKVGSYRNDIGRLGSRTLLDRAPLRIVRPS